MISTYLSLILYPEPWCGGMLSLLTLGRYPYGDYFFKPLYLQGYLYISPEQSLMAVQTIRLALYRAPLQAFPKVFKFRLRILFIA